MSGTTRRSWKIKTPTVKRPCGASISPRTVRALSTIAVLESASTNPKSRARSGASPTAESTTVTASTVSPTWTAPPTATLRQMNRSRSSENSSPMPKSRSTTPMSAMPRISSASVMSAKPLGPKVAPATRKPATIGRLRRLKLTAVTTASRPRIDRSRRSCVSSTVDFLASERAGNCCRRAIDRATWVPAESCLRLKSTSSINSGRPLGMANVMIAVTPLARSRWSRVEPRALLADLSRAGCRVRDRSQWCLRAPTGAQPSALAGKPAASVMANNARCNDLVRKWHTATRLARTSHKERRTVGMGDPAACR